MPGKKAPANETAEARFVRLANGRAAVALKAIDGIGKLVGSHYKSTAAQHLKLFGTLEARLDRAKKSLAENKPAVMQQAEGIL